MIPFLFTFACLSAAATCAVNLYAAAADGNLTTLKLSKQGQDYILEKQHVTDACAPQPIWLDFDRPNKVLFCLDRGGSTNSFKLSNHGELTRFDRDNTTVGPVSNTFYNSGKNRGMALAHYAGSAVTAWNAPHNGNLSLIQTFIFTSPTGPKPQQTAPHPHEAILDPTGRYIVVPDLGSDLLRIFTFDPDTNLLTEIDRVLATAGSGPRHGVFWTPAGSFNGEGPLFFHLIAELGNTITSYNVSYPQAGGIAFEKIDVISTYGNTSNPNGAAAEISISPDNRFIIASNRNDSSLQIPNFNPANHTAEPSDTLAVFKPMKNGTLSFIQLAPAGGIYPRHFKINKAGDLVAVGLQTTSRLVVMKRDVKTGLLGPFVAHIDNVGQVAMTVWDE